MKARLLKPSFIVGLSSSVRGGIAYNREELENKTEGGTEISKWNTTRTIDDKEEYEKAIKIRGKACSLIRSLCHHTGHYLFCPLEKEAELDVAIEEAKALVEKTNADLVYSRIDIFPIKLEFVNDEKEVARMMRAEVTELIEEMQKGINSLNATDIRAAANKARELSGALDENQSKVLGEAIAQARTAARAIVKRIEKQGEKAEVVLAEIKQNELVKARTAFLDLSAEEEETEALPIVDAGRVAGLDLGEDKLEAAGA